MKGCDSLVTISELDHFSFVATERKENKDGQIGDNHTLMFFKSRTF